MLTKDKNIRFLGWIQFLTECKFYGAVAVLYYSSVAGQMALGMAVFSVAMLSSAVLEIPTGILSDIVGRRKTLIGGAISAFVSVCFYAVGPGLAGLFLGAFFEGLSAALYSGNNDALLYDHLRAKNAVGSYPHFLGRTRSMAHLALSLSALAGSLLLLIAPFRFLFLLSVPPKALCVILAMRLIDPPRATGSSESDGAVPKAAPLTLLREAWREVAHRPALLWQILADSLAAGAGESSYQFRSKFLQLVWPTWAIGFTAVLSDVGAAVSYRISARWIHRRGRARVIILSKIYGAASNIAAYLLGSAWSPALLLSNSLLFGVTNVAQNEMSQELYSDRHRASMASLKSLAESLSGALLALLLGVAADIFGIVPALMAFQVFGLLSVGIYGALFARKKAK